MPIWNLIFNIGIGKSLDLSFIRTYMEKRPHCFRHTFATRAHRAGVDDKTLQTMGGWKDLATMKNIYVHTQDEDLEIARKILTSSNA